KYKFLTINDPNNIKIEMAKFTIFIIIDLIFKIIIGYTNNYYVHFVLEVVSNFFLLWILGGYCLFLVLLHKYKFRNISYDELSTIERVLNNRNSYFLFKQFAKKEWESEVLLLWDDIRDLKNQESESRKKDLSQFIYDTYLSDSSPLKVIYPSSNKPN